MSALQPASGSTVGASNEEAASQSSDVASSARRPGVRRPRSRHNGRAQLAAWAFIAPVVIYLAIFYAYPLYRNLDLSFRDYTLRSFIDGTAPFVWFDNYINILTDST